MEQNELLTWREKGNLPVISIAKDPFTVHWDERKLRYKGHTIDLSDPETSADGSIMQFFYNTRTKSEAKLPLNLTDLPRNVVLVQMPHQMKLDPWAVAKEHDLPMEAWLKQNPIQKHFTADTTPLWQSFVGKMAIQNREESKLRREARAAQKKSGKLNRKQRYAKTTG